MRIDAKVVTDIIGAIGEDENEWPVVGPEVWRLIEDALAEGGQAAAKALDCADVRSAETTWSDRRISSQEAGNIAASLRAAAFHAPNLGEVSVQLVGPTARDANPPGALVTLASAFDLLAALAGDAGTIVFTCQGDVD